MPWQGGTHHSPGIHWDVGGATAVFFSEVLGGAGAHVVMTQPSPDSCVSSPPPDHRPLGPGPGLSHGG